MAFDTGNTQNAKNAQGYTGFSEANAKEDLNKSTVKPEGEEKISGALAIMKSPIQILPINVASIGATLREFRCSGTPKQAAQAAAASQANSGAASSAEVGSSSDKKDTKDKKAQKDLMKFAEQSPANAKEARAKAIEEGWYDTVEKIDEIIAKDKKKAGEEAQPAVAAPEPTATPPAGPSKTQPQA